MSPPRQKIPAQRQPLRGWFSSSASTSMLTVSRPPLSPTSTKSPNSHSHSNYCIPYSINEEVPRLSLRLTRLANVTQNSSGSTAKLSSLNPSANRFALSIALATATHRHETRLPLPLTPQVPVCDSAMALGPPTRIGGKRCAGKIGFGATTPRRTNASRGLGFDRGNE